MWSCNNRITIKCTCKTTLRNSIKESHWGCTYSSLNLTPKNQFTTEDVDSKSVSTEPHYILLYLCVCITLHIFISLSNNLHEGYSLKIPHLGNLLSTLETLIRVLLGPNYYLILKLTRKSNRPNLASIKTFQDGFIAIFSGCLEVGLCGFSGAWVEKI